LFLLIKFFLRSNQIKQAWTYPEKVNKHAGFKGELFSIENLMPIKKSKSGYKWGSKGNTYPSKQQAQKQAKAAYASGYKKKKSSY